MMCSKDNSVHIIIQPCNAIVVVIRPCTCLTHELASKAPEGENNVNHKADEYGKHRQAKPVKPVRKVTRLEAGVLTLSFEETAPDGYLINNRNN